MIWPWVSRRAYDALAEGYAKALAREADLRLELTARTDALETLTREVYKDMLQLRRDGFNPVVPTVAIDPPEPTLPEPVRSAILTRGHTETERQRLRKWARGELAREVSPETVRHRILNGMDAEVPT